MSYLYILEINPLSVVSFANIFSHPEGCFFILFMVSFAVQKLLSLKMEVPGTSLVAQWIRLRTPNAGGLGSTPGQGTRSHMHATTKSLHATTKEPVSCN